MDTSKDYEKLNLNKLVAGTYYIKISGYRNAVNTYSLSINPPIASVVPPTPTPPATPSNVTATKTAQGQVSITWNSVVDAASYNVYRQDGQNLVLVATVTGTSYSVNELADGTYTFVVSAVSSNGESGKSTASVTLVSPPVAPSSLTATQTANGQVALTWNNVADVNSYNVYRQTGQDLILVGTLTSNSCTFNDLDDGLHSFAISSVSDNGESVKNIVTINVVNEVVIDEPPVGSNYENNNTFETAVDLGAITALTSIDGLELKTGEIADYYKFTFTATGDANSYARIDFINANGDLAVQLFDSSRKSVKTMDTSKDYEKLNLNKLVAGTYYIKISGYRNAVNAYSLSINPPAVSVVSAPVNLSATLSVETNPVPALTGDYQVYADNSAIILNNTPQQNNYTYTNLSNQFFATPTEFLANAPVIEIIGHEVMEDGKIRLQWSVKDESGETSPIRVSEVTTADAGVFQISATFNYYSSGKIMTGIVKSNAYSLSNSALPQLVEMY
jgi:fibronectin type 3 domain-containing protein